jgi:hypothetical protein
MMLQKRHKFGRADIARKAFMPLDFLLFACGRGLIPTVSIGTLSLVAHVIC